MDKHLLTELQIKDFKCFKDFKADGFKRVNLIGGKNNVGKTAFMEACYVNVRAQNIKSFVGVLNDIKYMREFLNIQYDNANNIKKYIEQSNKIFTKSNINLTSFNIEDENGIKRYNFMFNNQNIKVNINDFSYEYNYPNNIEFIDSLGMSKYQIINNFSLIQKKDKEVFLNNILRKFDEEIVSFKVIDDKPQCKVGEVYLEITELGDGVRHLISIITSLYKSEDGYLFIDEVENGIHYTKLDEIWTIILEVSKKLNVQVFSTTHSKECIESYARVSKKLEDEEISFIELGRNRNNELDSIVMNSERLIRYLKEGNEVRGW